MSDFDRKTIEGFLAGFEVPALPPKLTPKQLASATTTDKKVKDGKVNYILLKAVGIAITDNAVSERDLSAALDLVKG